MPRLQDILFLVFGVAVVILLAFHLRIAVFVLVGAFVCGSVYVFAGMLPARNESFWRRMFTSVFLASVGSCLVLILPGTFGAKSVDIAGTVLTIAASLPIAAFCFEVVRTPGLVGIILRSLRLR